MEITYHSHGGFCWPFGLRAHSHVPFPPLPRMQPPPTVIPAYVDAGGERDSLSGLNCCCRRKEIQKHPTLRYPSPVQCQLVQLFGFRCKSLKAWVHSGISILMRERTPTAWGPAAEWAPLFSCVNGGFYPLFLFFPFFFLNRAPSQPKLLTLCTEEAVARSARAFLSPFFMNHTLGKLK